MNIDKEIEKSYEVEKNLKDKLEKEIKTEEEIKKNSIDLADKLLKKRKAVITIDKKPYSLVMKINTINKKMFNKKTSTVEILPLDYISIIAADVNKYKLSRGKYIPFTISAEIDKRYSVKDNLKTVCEAFIRHVTGQIKAEYIDN